MLGLEIISNQNKMILLELEMADRSRSRSRSYRNFDRSFFWIAINRKHCYQVMTMACSLSETALTTKEI